MKTISGQVEETKRLEPPPRIRFGASSALLEYAVRPFPHLYKSGNEVGVSCFQGGRKERTGQRESQNQVAHGSWEIFIQSKNLIFVLYEM